MKNLKLTSKLKEHIIAETTKTLDKMQYLTDITFNAKEYLNKTIKKPTIVISADLIYKMLTLVDESPTEISWHGFVHRNAEKQIYHIYDITLFPQINSACATNTDQTKYTEWLQKYITDPNSNFEDLRMHGHSHVNMDVFSSNVDDTYQQDLLKNCPENDYYIFFIMNKKHENCILLYDFTQQILFETDDITIEIISSDKKPIRNWAKKNIEEYCTTPEYYQPYGNNTKINNKLNFTKYKRKWGKQRWT